MAGYGTRRLVARPDRAGSRDRVSDRTARRGKAERDHALLAFGIAAVSPRPGSVCSTASGSFADHETAGGCSLLAALAVGAFFHEDHFVLLLVTTVLLYSVATLG